MTEREIETGEGKGDRDGEREGGRKGGGRRKRDSVKLQILFLVRSSRLMQHLKADGHNNI